MPFGGEPTVAPPAELIDLIDQDAGPCDGAPDLEGRAEGGRQDIGRESERVHRSGRYITKAVPVAQLPAPAWKTATTISLDPLIRRLEAIYETSSGISVTPLGEDRAKVTSTDTLSQRDRLLRGHTRDRIAPVAGAGGADSLCAEHVSCSGNQVADGDRA